MLAALAKTKLATQAVPLPNHVAKSAEHYKLFTLLLARRAPNMFSMDQCVLGFSKQKEGMARVALERQFNIQNAFTMESSSYGAALPSSALKGFHVNPEHYLQMGAILCTLHLMLAPYDLQTHEATVANLKPPRPTPTSMAN